MRVVAAAIAIATASLPAAAQVTASPSRDEPGYHARLFERYCEKTREGPEAYGRFVNRMRLLHGYDHFDFVAREPGREVRSDCRVKADRLASAPQAPAAPAR